MNRLKYESLHSHTSISDGNQTHAEVLDSAEKLGIGTVAFTDHDIVPDQGLIKQLRAYEGPVNWIFGIEITSGLPKEMDDDASLHILGLFINPTNSDLLDYSHDMQQARLKRVDHYVEHFRSLGLKVTKDEVIAAAEGSPVGSPHMVKAIYANRDNLKVIEKLLVEFEEAAQNDEALKAKYEKMKEQGDNQIPYRLFMTRHSFKPVPEGSHRKKLMNLDETVNLIHEAEGVAIFAHWFYEKEDIPAAKIKELVENERIDGIETDSENAITKHTHTEEVEYLESLVNEFDCIETVGADSHSEKDLVAYVNSSAAKKSIGHTRRIIEKANVNTEWSNLNG